MRIGEGVVGGLIALIAALGLWQRKKWGLVLALVVAAASLLAAVATFATPFLGRSPWLMFMTSSTWQAVAGAVLAVLAAVLVLLPASRKAYVVAPKERRVM